MKTDYKYFKFEKDEDLSIGKKTDFYYCVNKTSGNDIGSVKWYGPWRQYCFFTKSEGLFGYIVFSAGCLKDIEHFIKQLMDEMGRKS